MIDCTSFWDGHMGRKIEKIKRTEAQTDRMKEEPRCSGRFFIKFLTEQNDNLLHKPTKVGMSRRLPYLRRVSYQASSYAGR